ncbi:protein root UVB sensitive 4 isoform X2 [Amborella trichopoda]|uniref:protein root UVB sensitive 4 isoform X2 n=1 Tax=Amborella trichopoda TaxID=13333 RepID=UPI0009BEB728|nr:protein root UVB sensitive 4 isoform X2 [Amborella trichopoda]|eukprot:XP_020527501.1 protein root UVB sensitive 4 isoform X2 [Amborella trichopoda]
MQSLQYTSESFQFQNPWRPTNHCPCSKSHPFHLNQWKPKNRKPMVSLSKNPGFLHGFLSDGHEREEQQDLVQKPWVHTSNHLLPKPHQLKLNQWKLRIRKPMVSLSKDPGLSSGFWSESYEREEEHEFIHLPVVFHQGSRVSQYTWDGKHIKLVGFHEEGLNCIGSLCLGRVFGNWVEMMNCSARKLFVPQKVQENYMGYLKWKLLHRVFSSALKVVATQAMFRAIGIGNCRSLASAAALNWVLKDGLGRLSRCIYTASLGSAFDTNLKRVRFSTSLLFSLSIGVEMLTPYFPNYFLLLATIANVGKSISLAAYLATGSAIHRSFAIADNLGEVSAKAQDRLEIIIRKWIYSGYVPSAAEVSDTEGISFLRLAGSEPWPIRIGCVDSKDPSPQCSVLTMQSLGGDDLYFICMETSCKGFRRKRQRGMVLCLHEGAGNKEIILGMLQACYMRRALVSDRCSLALGNGSPCSGYWSPVYMREWFEMVEESKQYARAEVSELIEEMRKLGWAVKNVLLNTQEQIRYSFNGA